MKWFGIILLVLVPLLGMSQSGVIELQNPSFEFRPEDDAILQEWLNCGGFNEESKADIQPGTSGCTTPALHGNHYIGLVTRNNGTWMSICQVLNTPLQIDSIYWFAICLANSTKYYPSSKSIAPRLSRGAINYIDPVKLRIWGIGQNPDQSDLLAETTPVNHDYWRIYSLKMTAPKFEVTQLVLEAYYPNSDVKTAGNLLIDHCSAIYPNAMKAEFMEIKQDLRPERSTDEVIIVNPSFERTSTKLFTLPNGWSDFRTFETPHRTHPAHHEYIAAVQRENNETPLTFYGSKVVKPNPTDGEAFASLLATENGRKQCLITELEGILRKDVGYTFNLDLAYSKKFKERERGGTIETIFAKPLRLFIWGGYANNPKAELLAQSQTILKPVWQKVHFVLKPALGNYDYLTLEAGYDPAIGKEYNGNLLLDHCSSLQKIK